MPTIAADLQQLISSLQDEMETTNTQFKLMLELRTVVVAEYEAMARQYISLKNEIRQHTNYMNLLLEALKTERAELEMVRSQYKTKIAPKFLSSKPQWTRY